MIALGATILVSPDSALVLAAAKNHGHIHCVALIKHALKFVGLCAASIFIIVADSSAVGGATHPEVPAQPVSPSLDAPALYFCAALLNGSAEILVTLSVYLTGAANALFLLNLSPLWCALLGRLLLKEELKRKTTAAVVWVLVWVILLLLDEIRLGGGWSSTRLFGATLAVAAGICNAGFLVACKKTQDREMGRVPKAKVVSTPDAPTASSSVRRLIFISPVSALVSTAVGGIISAHTPGVRSCDAGDLQGWLPVALGGLVISPLALVGFIFATRKSNPTTISFVMLLEVILGPLWVWIAFGEIPPPTGCACFAGLGSGLVVFHSLSAFAARPQQPPQDSDGCCCGGCGGCGCCGCCGGGEAVAESSPDELSPGGVVVGVVTSPAEEPSDGVSS